MYKTKSKIGDYNNLKNYKIQMIIVVIKLSFLLDNQVKQVQN